MNTSYHNRLIAASVIAAFVSGASAQTADSNRLISGYVHDAVSRSLRPVVGVPGSAHLGTPAARQVDAAWVSPRNNAALVIRDGVTVLLLGLGTSSMREETEGLLASPARAAWNVSGDTLVLYSGEARSIQRVSVRGESVTTRPAAALDHLGPVAAVTVDNSGRIAVATDSGIYVIRDSSGPERISDSTAAALAWGTADRLYAATEQGILAVTVTDSTSRTLVTGIRASALGVSGRSSRIWAIEDEGHKLHLFNLEGEPGPVVDLERTPTSLGWLVDDSLLLLNGPESKGQPALLLDLTADPGVFFVPAEPVSAL